MNPSSPSGLPTLPPPPSDGKYRVLVVEDDANIARLVMITLAQAGFEVRHAADGPAALEAFRTIVPHLVLLDLNLPGISGGDLCTEIRKSSTVPVIVMTASESEAVAVQSFKLGADDFVSKPFHPQILLARIVANLRRAYRYGAAPEVVAAPPARDLAAVAGIAPAPPPREQNVPPGWAVCESCNYMGPRQRFEHEDNLGRNTLLCPNCRQSEFVTFSLG